MLFADDTGLVEDSGDDSQNSISEFHGRRTSKIVKTEERHKTAAYFGGW